MSRFLSCAVPIIAMCFLLGLSGSASAQISHATLTSPPNGRTYNWSFFSSNYPSITISCSNVYVSSSGAANANFTVSYNMYLKKDGSSLVSNDTSHGDVTRTYNSLGYWERLGWGTGSNSSTDTYNETFEEHYAEASANITVGTVASSTTDTHNFYVVMTYY